MLCVSVISVAALAACGSGSEGGSESTADSSETAPKELAKVSFLMPGGFSVIGMPVIYAKTEGIFEKYGVDLTIENPSSAGGATSVQYIQQDRFDMGYTSVDQLMIGRQKSSYDVVAFYGWIQKNARCFIVPTKSHITSPEDLAGKTVGLVSTTNNTSYLALLEKAGVKDKVTTQSLAQAASTGAYLAGKIDAVTGYGFQQVPALTAAGVPSAGLCEWDAGMHYMQAVIGARQTYIDAHPDVVQAVANALTDALNDMESDPTQAIADFKKADTDGVTPPVETLKEEVVQMLDHFRTPNGAGHEWGWMSPQDWAETKNQGEALWEIDPSYDADSTYTNQFTQ